MATKLVPCPNCGVQVIANVLHAKKKRCDVCEAGNDMGYPIWMFASIGDIPYVHRKVNHINYDFVAGAISDGY